MKREPNDEPWDAGVGAATCRACSEELAPDAAYCHQCGCAQVDDDWVECQISYRRDGLHGEFTAVYRGEAPWSIAGRSKEFRWIGRGGEPPRTAAAEERLAGLCHALEREGWRLCDAGPVDPWYRLTFGRGIGAPRREPTAEVHRTSDLEGQAALTLVPVEEVAEPVEVAVTDEPVVVRLVPVGEAAEPVDVPVVEEAQLVPVQQSAEPAQAAVLDSPVEPPPIPLEAPEPAQQPDREPLVSLADGVPEPPEDVVVGPWYRQPPRPAPVTLAEESELCSRISVYVARAG